MKILTVCREIPEKSNIHNYKIAEFIFEQNEAVSKHGVTFDYYLIKKKGIIGYLSHLKGLIKKIKSEKYDFIHAHGGHIGSLCNLQRMVPVITSYRGSDINTKRGFILSIISLKSSFFKIFVNRNMAKIAGVKSNFDIIPAGIDFSIFKPKIKVNCRKYFNWDLNKKIILFGGKKNVPVKNFSLAKDAISFLNQNIKIVELKGFTREEVAIALNACDCVLLTSFSEGSPNIIKEALACNRPIVSTDVGDVKELSKGIDGVFITDYTIESVASSIKKAFGFSEINSREKVLFLEQGFLSNRLFNLYRNNLNKIKNEKIYL